MSGNQNGINPWVLFPGGWLVAGTRTKFDNVTDAQGEKSKLDLNGDGNISQQEMASIVASADSNGDGKLNKSERNAFAAKTGIHLQKGGIFDKVTTGEAMAALSQRANHLNAILGANGTSGTQGCGNGMNFDPSQFGYQGQGGDLQSQLNQFSSNGSGNSSGGMPTWLMGVLGAVTALGPIMMLMNLFKKN